MPKHKRIVTAGEIGTQKVAELKKNSVIGKTTQQDPVSKMRKYARAVVSSGEPDYYHPLMQESTLMLPTKFREINQYCFIPGTKVLMNDGTEKNIENILVDDEVITHLGNVKKVTKVFNRFYDGEMMVIKSVGNRIPLQMTPNHKLWAIKNDDIKCKYSNDNWPQKCHPFELSKCNKCDRTDINGFDFIRSDSLVKNDCLTDIIPQYKQSIPKWATSDFLRLLGLYAAEGSVMVGRGNVWGVCFTFSYEEFDTLAEETVLLIEKLFGKKVKKYLYPKRKPEVTSIRVYSKEIAEYISKYITGDSHTKKLSNEILCLPEALLLQLLSGIIDGDGHVVKNGTNKNLIEISTVSDDLASQVYQICKICRMVPYRYKNKNINRVKISAKYVKKLKNLIVKKMADKLVVKSSKFIYDKWNIVQIKDIHKVNYSGEVFNIEVEDDHSYIANGVCVSNCRHFFRTDAMCQAAINFHSEFAINGFRNICEDKKIQDFFDDLAFDVIKLPQLLSFICLEWYKLGNVFPYGVWDEDEGRWDRFIALNPDYVEIEKTLFSEEPMLKLDPDEGLKRIVTNKEPRQLYDQLDPQIVAYVSKGQKIPLSSLVIETDDNEFEFPQVTHLARKASPYEVYGTPMMLAAFKVLAYKDLLRKAQFAIGKRHWKPIKVVKVGDDNHKPTEDMLDAVEEAIKYADEDSNSWLVWHHYIAVDYIASAGHVMPLQAEYDWIDRELMRALEISDAVLTNQGMTFANASVSLRVMVNKYQRFQKMLSDFIKNFIYKPVAEVQGFYKTNEEGKRELIIPDIEWELMRLQDDAQLKSVLQGLQQRGLISRHTLMTYIGLDYEKEKKLIQKEQVDDQIFMRPVKPEMGKPPAGMPPGAPGGAGVPPLGKPGVPGATPIPGAPPATPGAPGAIPPAEGIPPIPPLV